MKGIAKSENIYDQIDWVAWVEYDQMDAIYKKSSAFLFPSHEGAGMVVPEAMSYGLPVICFNNNGPGELSGTAGLKVEYSDYATSIQRFSDHLTKLFESQEYRKKISEKSRIAHKKSFTWGHKREVINHIYNQF